MAELDTLFEELLELGGSDLHLTPGHVPLIRESGTMRPLDGPKLEADELERQLAEIMPERNRKEFQKRNDTDFAYEIPGRLRLRSNAFRDRHGMGGSFRVIPTRITPAEELHLTKAMTDLCYLPKGLVLVTGPTGCGKSTTLAALIDLVNRSRHDHIITIEDPIEFIHDSKCCLVNQREVHSHTDSFADALRAALREDPDIVLVGEMRDLETIEIAIETAETGHLVFGTLHTTTAASTVDRIVDSFPSDRQNQIRTMLASSLRAVISQSLCRRNTKGRVAAFELLLVTHGVSSLIRDAKTYQIQSAMQMGRGLGMMSMNDSLVQLVRDGLIDPEEGHLRSIDKDNLLSLYEKYEIPPPDLGTEDPSAIQMVPQAPTDPSAVGTPGNADEQTKLTRNLDICGQTFECSPLSQAELNGQAGTYVILGVDKWGKWSVLDVGQTDENGSDKDARKREKRWHEQCPSGNIWLGVCYAFANASDRKQGRALEARIRKEHHTA